MSQEIIEGIQAIEKEKGIEEGILITALEDALRAAYKKTPGATRHAEVKLDDAGEFRVYGIEIPEDIEARLVEEAREARITELEQLEEETGERQHTLITDDDLELDWSQVPPDQIVRTDVTPDDFGRIAAQTAKQVIQQRIREAERAIMYEEYVDRQGEVVTGIVQQAGDRNNVLVDLGRVESLLPRSEQVDGERYEQGSRIKAVIAEVRSGTKGPQVILSRRDPGAHPRALRARGAGDRRRPRRDPWRCPRARLPLEDRGRVAHAGRRPGRRVRRPARLARAHGRVRAPRREDRHHPVEHGACALRREGAVARARAGGLHRRRDARGDRRRPQRPARPRDRQGGARMPASRRGSPAGRSTSSPSRSSPRPRPSSRTRAPRTARSSPAAVRRCSRTASAARTRRCRVRTTAAFRRTRRSRRASRGGRCVRGTGGRGGRSSRDRRRDRGAGRGARAGSAASRRPPSPRTRRPRRMPEPSRF